MEPPVEIVRVEQRRRKASKIARGFVLLRRMQHILGLSIPIFCLVNRFIYLRQGHSISPASEIVTKVAGWTGFATFILAGLGILNTKREKHYFSILLLVDLAACTSCLISAMCLTVLFITYWWINKGLWITGVTLAWTCFFLSLALLVRTTLIRRRIRGAVEIPIAVARGRTRESARGSARGSDRESTRESTREIDMWRQDVTPEEGPLIPNYAPSQFSFDPYADDETEHASSRSSSPVSTVAHWTTVSGTNTLITQYTEPPPLYSRFER